MEPEGKDLFLCNILVAYSHWVVLPNRVSMRLTRIWNTFVGYLQSDSIQGTSAEA